MVFDAHEADTPTGNPVEVPIPVAPVVAMVIAFNAVLIHKVGEADGIAAVMKVVTVSTAGGEEIICEHVPVGALMTTSKLPAFTKVTFEIVNVDVVAVLLTE